MKRPSKLKMEKKRVEFKWLLLIFVHPFPSSLPPPLPSLIFPSILYNFPSNLLSFLCRK
uniref:Uncharacterized protein n=1 Tax=Meloidogyne enterolobii TaxID=390850 RepID=A0A6V7UP54_MELEN|nr:unnamed protein product [Meloidogyne enterolobii]